MADRNFGTRLAGYGLRIPHARIPQPTSNDAWGDNTLGMPASSGRFYARLLDQDHCTFDADRTAGDDAASRCDGAREGAREMRAFTLRATREAARMGLRQFVDVGAGPPLWPSVAQVAGETWIERWQEDPATAGEPPAVAYVDNDESVTYQTYTMDARGETVAAITGDLRDPLGILTHPELAKVIDRKEPVCLLLCSVLHFVSPDEAREALVGTHEKPGFLDLIAPGSLVAISVGMASREVMDDFAEVGIHTHAHEPGHIAAYFEGLEVCAPGLVAPRDWRPDEEVHYAFPRTALAGMGRKLRP